jgi:hypothetical protein
MTWGIYNNKSLAYLCSSGKKKATKATKQRPAKNEEKL